MVEYNVGDKIIFTGSDRSSWTRGGIYEVIETDNGDDLPVQVIDDIGGEEWLYEEDFELLAVLHPLFDEWYDMFKSYSPRADGYKSLAIMKINQMGWGHGLEDPRGVRLNDVMGGGKWNALWDDARMNKEKYTRAILDDDYVLDKPKRWVLKLNDKIYRGNHLYLTTGKANAYVYTDYQVAISDRNELGGTIEEA